MKQLQVLSLFLFSFVLLAQETGSIKGVITDKENENQPLAFANAVIKGTTQGSTTDFDGIFLIENVPVGVYTLVFSFIGYETVEKNNIIIAPNKTTQINLSMGAGEAGLLNEVVISVSSRQDSEQAILLNQKKAIQIKEAISAQALSKKGIGDAAEAVAQIAGISKQQGAGKVYVRGLGDRYQNTTINGLLVPSNDVEKKNIDLNLFPSDIIENVSVSKAYTASVYGDFAAGNVDVNTTQYTGNGFFNINVSSGFNTNTLGQWDRFVIHDGLSTFGHWKRFRTNEFSQVIQHGVDPEAANFPLNSSMASSGGISFNLNEESRFSLFASLSYNNSYQYEKGLEGNYSDTPDILFPEVEKFTYTTNTTGVLNLLYRINDNNKLRTNAIVITDTKSQIGNYGIGGNGFENDLGEGSFFTYNSQFDQNTLLINQLLGEHKIKEKLSLLWGVGYNLVYANQPDRRRIALNIRNPESILFITNNNFDSQRYFQEIDDEEVTGNLLFDYQSENGSKLRLGYTSRNKSRSFQAIRYGYDQRNFNRNIGNFPSIDRNRLNDVFNLENFVFNLDDNPDNNLFNLTVLRPLFSENPFPVGNTRQNLPGAPESTYSGKLSTHAAFAEYQWKLNEKWLVIPGVRFENYDQVVSYDDVNAGQGTVGFNQTEFLPSLNVKFTPNERINYRFSFSRSVSLPEFKEVAPFTYVDVTQRTGGNPDLLNDTSVIYNFDLKWEFFPAQEELISASVFTKLISNPVNLVLANDAANTRRFFRTGSQAEVFGAELEVAKFIFKTDRFSLKAGGNIAYTHTRQDLKKNIAGIFAASFTEKDSDGLEGASPLIVNADFTLSYNKNKNYNSSLTFSGGYFSDRIFAIGASGRGNQIEKGIPTINLSWLNNINKQYQINLKIRNLLDPRFLIEQENTNQGTVAIESFRKGISVGLSFKYTF